ncbi:hypothetical protein MBANPS3_009197 [Mucor bainieri]
MKSFKLSLIATTWLCSSTCYAVYCDADLKKFSAFNLVSSNVYRGEGDGSMLFDGSALIAESYNLDNAVINLKRNIQCDFTSYAYEKQAALWLGKGSALNTTLYGGHVLGLLSDSHFIKRTNDDCVLRYTHDFFEGYYMLELNGLMMAQDLINYPATHYLDSQGTIHPVANATANEADYHVFTFQSCTDAASCAPYPDDGQTSDPRGLLFGANDWQGPTTAWPTDKVILFNIPVNPAEGLTIQGTHDLMANGLKACGTIWNTYPSTQSNDKFVLTFANSHPIGGQFIAPTATFFNNQSTVDAILYGSIYTRTYIPRLTFDSRLGHFDAFGESCAGKFDCWPIANEDFAAIDNSGQLANDREHTSVSYSTIEPQETLIFTSWYFDGSTSTAFSTWTETLSPSTATSTSIDGITGTVLVVTQVPTSVLTHETVSSHVTTEYTPSVVIATVTAQITATATTTWTQTENAMAIASTTLTVDKPYTTVTETTVSVFNSVTGVRETTEIVNIVQ